MTLDTLRPSDAPLLLDEATESVLFRDARTVNTFAADDVTDAQLEAVYDLVRWGPTAMNTSPLRLLVVRRPTARERLTNHMGDGNRVKTQHAPLSIVVATDVDFHEQMPRLAPPWPASRVPRRGTTATRERSAQGQRHPAVAYFIVGVRAAGLAAGPMGGFDAAGVDADLLEGTSWRSVLVLNVGQAPAERDDLGMPATWPRQTRLDWADAARTV